MTDPLDEWYRAAIAETMRPCPELPRTARDAEAFPKPGNGRRLCPSCGKEYAAGYLSKHIRTRHPKAVDNAGDNADRGAA